MFYQLSIQDVDRLYQSSRQLGACANPAKIVLQVSAKKKKKKTNTNKNSCYLEVIQLKLPQNTKGCKNVYHSNNIYKLLNKDLI